MNNSLRITLSMIGCFLWFMATGLKAEAEFNLSGSFYSDIAINQYEQSDDSDTLKYAGENALRFNFKNFITPNAKVEGSFDLLLLAGDKSDLYLDMFPEEQDHSWSILGTRLVPLFETRKLYLSFFADDYTLTLGRQIINYGVGTIFSPIDCFSTVNLQDIGMSRIGSDIIRVQIPLGDLAGVEGVTTFSSATDTVSAVKFFGNLWDCDLSLTGIYKKAQEEALIGFTFKGDLLVGIHSELVEHYNSNTNTNYFEGMVGTDYSFADGKLLLLVEYDYSGNPVAPGRQLFGQASFAFDEIRMLSLNGIYNLSDGSRIGTLQFLYNIFQNTNLLLYTRYYNGNLTGLEIQNIPKAEYGMRVEWKF